MIPSGTMFNSKWSQDYLDLQKNMCIYIHTHIHTLAENKLYTKLTYFDHLNKMLNTLTLESRKIGFNKNKNNATSITFSISFHNKSYMINCYLF